MRRAKCGIAMPLPAMAFWGILACTQGPTVARTPTVAPAASTDTTDNWIRVAPSDTATNCQALMADPRVGGVIYAGCRNQGFFVSRDAGRTWVTQNQGLPGLDVTSWQEAMKRETGAAFNPKGITIDPKNPRTIYGALEWSGVFKSTDGGETWQRRAEGLEPGMGHNAIHVAADPSNPEVLYLATDGGIYKSVNGAASWRRLKTGLPVFRGKKGTTAMDFAIDPTRPSTVYAAYYTGGESDSSGVYKSLDAGESWRLMTNGVRGGQRLPPLQSLQYRMTVALVMDPVAPATLYAVTGDGVYKTIDGAEHWSLLPKTDSIGVGFSLLIDPRDSRTLYLGVHYPFPGRRSGVYMSRDAGATWRWIGLKGRGIVWDLNIDAGGDGAVYAAVVGGVYRLSDPRRRP